MSIAPDVADGTAGEDGSGSGTVISFDTYNNDNEGAPAIQVKYAGQWVSSLGGTGALFRQGKFIDVRIEVKSDSTLNLVVDNNLIYTNFYGAFSASPLRFGFGARTGGSYDNHWIDDIHIVTSTAPATEPAHPLVVSNATPITAVTPEPVFFFEVRDFATQLRTDTVKLLLNGEALTPTVTKVDDLTTIECDPPGALPPLSVNTCSLIYTDTGGYTTTNDFSFSVVSYHSVILPDPIYLETFDTAPEGGLPTGWTRTNNTTILNDWEDLADPNSDSYLGWTVVDRSRLDGNPFNSRRLNVAPGYLNGAVVTNLVYGQCVYAESDNRDGNQIQMLFTKDYDLTGKTDVYLSFNSIYEQNQDSLFGVEYSINQGQSWLPVVYMLDDQGGTADIVRVTNDLGQVSIDAAATLNKPQTDTPQVDDGTGTGTTRRTFWYEFIEARPLESLGPYIDGRINDDPTESKRVELFRVPQADNQAQVRFRFVQAGTGSWYSGFDNFGLYSIAPAVGPTLSISRTDWGVTISWPATGFTLQRTPSLSGTPTWTDVPITPDAKSVSITIGTDNQFFRLTK